MVQERTEAERTFEEYKEKILASLEALKMDVGEHDPTPLERLSIDGLTCILTILDSGIFLKGGLKGKKLSTAGVEYRIFPIQSLNRVLFDLAKVFNPLWGHPQSLLVRNWRLLIRCLAG